MPYQAFKFFKRNTQGRDFIVGDIHGHFSALEQLLLQARFDPTIDRVFSVGDLIDRGPESLRIVEFLNYPWFHAIMGNHERMLLDSVNSTQLYKNWTEHNGGAWWNDIPTALRPRLRNIISQLPLAFEVDSIAGRIGIVHADIPNNCPWQRFIADLYHDTDIIDYALWSRHRFKQLQMMGRTLPISGIDLVVFGHTPVTRILQQANIYYIDTGACYPDESQLGTLTLLELGVEIKMHHIKTKQGPWNTPKLSPSLAADTA